MAVYLGNQGGIELKRDSLNQPMFSDLDPDDVNVSKKRFSFDFDTGALISGDQVDIDTVDGSDLGLVSGKAGDGWRGYIHVDDSGGVRLYTTFEGGIDGGEDSALALLKPTATKKIKVSTRGSVYRCLAQVQSYELTNSRDAVDITSLGEEFKRNYANGLISGQGSLTCLWDYQPDKCDDMAPVGAEFSQYLAQLVIRLQQGADFVGRFTLHCQDNKAVWQDADCIVTNVGINVESTQIIRSTINFVTTGKVKLRIGEPPSNLLLEGTVRSGGLLLQEDAKEIDIEDGD